MPVIVLIAVIAAALGLTGCGTRQVSDEAYRAFVNGCDWASFQVDLRDSTNGDRTFFARCTPNNRSTKP